MPPNYLARRKNCPATVHTCRIHLDDMLARKGTHMSVHKRDVAATIVPPRELAGKGLRLARERRLVWTEAFFTRHTAIQKQRGSIRRLYFTKLARPRTHHARCRIGPFEIPHQL